MLLGILVAVCGLSITIFCIKRNQRRQKLRKRKQKKRNTRRTRAQIVQQGETYEETVFQSTSRAEARGNYASLIADPYAYNDLWLPGDSHVNPNREISWSYDDIRYSTQNLNDASASYYDMWARNRQNSFDTCSEPVGRTEHVCSISNREDNRNVVDPYYLKVLPAMVGTTDKTELYKPFT